MQYVYRRPFDYAAHAQRYNLWQLVASVDATVGAGAFTTYAAALTLTPGANEQSSRTTRFISAGVYRKRWNYAVYQSRINLFYTDATEVFAAVSTGAWSTYAARVQLGAVGGSTLLATKASLAFTTYFVSILGGRRDPIADGEGTFTTYSAAITRTAGLGVSRTGAVSTKGSGVYSPGRVSARGRAHVVGVTEQVIKSK